MHKNLQNHFATPFLHYICILWGIDRQVNRLQVVVSLLRGSYVCSFSIVMVMEVEYLNDNPIWSHNLFIELKPKDDLSFPRKFWY